jgi:hypothetical protein
MLQSGMSRVRFQMKLLNFYNLLNLSGRTMALGFTQLATEMSTRNLIGGGGGVAASARKADYLTTICETTVWKMLDSRRLNPIGLQGLLQGKFKSRSSMWFSFLTLSTKHVVFTSNPLPRYINDVDNNNSIQFNSIPYYLCAESTATRPITDIYPLIRCGNLLKF